MILLTVLLVQGHFPTETMLVFSLLLWLYNAEKINLRINSQEAETVKRDEDGIIVLATLTHFRSVLNAFNILSQVNLMKIYGVQHNLLMRHIQIWKFKKGDLISHEKTNQKLGFHVKSLVTFDDVLCRLM